jgi:hypothetical protein
VRVVVLTVLAALLSFAVSLFAGIVGTVLVGWAGGHRPNLVVAYRGIAFPVAVVVGVAGFVVFLTTEIRRYREAKLLAQMDRTSGSAPVQ